MFFYDKTPRELLVDLINEANPDLPTPLNTTDYDFMNPVAITETEAGHNTQIRVIARPTAPYLGNVLLTYRRLHLANLFQGVTPFVRKWVVNGGSSTATTTRAQLYDLLPLYSKKYGLVLDQDNISDLALQERYGIDETLRFNMTAKTTSMIYTGSVPTQWIIGRRELSDLLAIDEIDGRLYPGGNDFTDPTTRALYLSPMLFDLDFTLDNMETTLNWEYYTTGTVGAFVGNTSDFRALWYKALFPPFAREYERVTGQTPVYTLQGSFVDTPHDFTGFGIAVTSLPNTSYPEANSDYYNRVVVFSPPASCTWATGNIYMHYNV